MFALIVFQFVDLESALESALEVEIQLEGQLLLEQVQNVLT